MKELSEVLQDWEAVIGLETVSYTHLDVYKRQVTQRAGCRNLGSKPGVISSR